MGQPLRALIIEDSENDAIFLLKALQRGGYDPQYQRVFTAEALASALDKQDWDIVLSDYVMPGFSGLKALEIVHRRNPDIPFIVVSGQIGEDVAVTAMRAGAQDYIMKDNLKRLVPAVERELTDAVVRKQARDADELLRQTSSRLKMVTDAIQDVFWISSPGGREIVYLSPAFDSLWGIPREEAYKAPRLVTNAVHPLDRPVFSEMLAKSALGQQFMNDFRIIRPDESVKWVRNRGFPVRGQEGSVTSITGIMTDITELRAVNRALMTLTHCNEALVRCSTEQALLQSVCQAVVEAGGYLMSWVGYIEQGKTRVVKPRCWAGKEDGYLQDFAVNVGDRNEQGPVAQAMRTGKPAVVRDIMSDPSFEKWRDSAAKRGYGSIVALPLKDKRAFGALCIYAGERDAFNNEEVTLLEQLAEDLSYGIKALRVRVERDQAETELRALANRLVQMQEDERRNISRELHDETGQQMTFLKMLLGRASKKTTEPAARAELEDAQKVASEVISQVRNLSLSLRPGLLDLGLLPALQWAVQEFSSKTKIAIDFNHSGLERNFSQPLGTAIYRIVQEALTNVARYAKVDRAAVYVSAGARKIMVQVSDKGAGFDPAAVPLTSSGLRGARERALSLGGKLTVESGPGKGTRVTVVLPLPADEGQTAMIM